MSAPREKTAAVKSADLIDVLDQISDIQTSAACARLILAGIMAAEAGSDAYDPLAGFLLRLEGEVDALATTAARLQGGAA